MIHLLTDLADLQFEFVLAFLEFAAFVAEAEFPFREGAAQLANLVPGELAFPPEAKEPTHEPCAVVGMILEDRSAAIWKFAGGTAIKKAKGLAGPDLSTTGETIERFGKGCKGSNMFFVSAGETVEWGLAYDLAASTRSLSDVKFDNLVLLEKTPTSGRKVELTK